MDEKIEKPSNENNSGQASAISEEIEQKTTNSEEIHASRMPAADSSVKSPASNVPQNNSWNVLEQIQGADYSQNDVNKDSEAPKEGLWKNGNSDGAQVIDVTKSDTIVGHLKNEINDKISSCSVPTAIEGSLETEDSQSNSSVSKPVIQDRTKEEDNDESTSEPLQINQFAARSTLGWHFHGKPINTSCIRSLWPTANNWQEEFKKITMDNPHEVKSKQIPKKKKPMTKEQKELIHKKQIEQKMEEILDDVKSDRLFQKLGLKPKLRNYLPKMLNFSVQKNKTI